jgi:hypothetical protein
MDAAIEPFVSMDTAIGPFVPAAGPAAGETSSPIAPSVYVRDSGRWEAAVRETAALVKSESRQDYASGGAFANFREITLGDIPARLLYRGSHPALPGNSRFPYAQQLAENARVATVINLADTPEQLASNAENIPWYQNFINRNTILSLAMNSDYTAPEFEARLKSALVFMADHNQPYLIHGIEGRERTGFLAAVIEALMGASAEEIKTDYMLSYVNLYKIAPEAEAYRTISYFAEDMLLRITEGKPPASTDLRVEAERYLINRIGLGRDALDSLKGRLSRSR